MEENEIKKITKINSVFDESFNFSIPFDREKENDWLSLKLIFDELLSKSFINHKVWYQCLIITRLNLDLPIISKGIISVNK